MFRSALVSGLVSATLLAAPMAFAQETAPAPAADAATPTAPAPDAAGPVLAATFRDWQIICSPEVAGQPQTCEMYQLLLDPSDAPIAELSIAALPLGAEFAAGATVTTPLETFLPTGLGFRIGQEENMRVEGFRVCTVVGCVVRMGLSPDEITRMKAGSSATVTIAPFVAIDQPVEINVSLAGFTAAYDDLQTRLAAAAAAARANP
ncbi:invasion associated locus B family protein [Pararhodobacter zhoushanensis]|uniref:Invasion associated locus B family protein n=1 Tax=Pararhodobacter zhoushanensis TaxID=2479545 RepID=A0ABT3GXB6_9RHOB|nr:invasion associated locus B family protein [Pararhodobacter zhoushanensis]MCW1932189.1 invasion associated locus B family protein [Pararhodobacter zhoushanensis]